MYSNAMYSLNTLKYFYIIKRISLSKFKRLQILYRNRTTNFKIFDIDKRKKMNIAIKKINLTVRNNSTNHKLPPLNILQFMADNFCIATNKGNLVK